VVCDGVGNVAAAPATNAGDIPQDGNDCTNDICVGATPQNNNVGAGTNCGANGVCNAIGQCVGCNGPTDCGTNTDCYSWTCDGSQTCQQNFVSSGTPTSTQVAQNCLEQVCNGAGQAIQVPDNDPIIDGNPCTADNCNAGTPENPPLAINAGCMGSMFCDGNGACVQCNQASQCPVMSDGDCESDQCVAKSCAIVFDPLGTPAPAIHQTAQDCTLQVCNGLGSLGAAVADPGDVFNDGIECTADVCSGTTPQNNPKPSGTMCAAGFCDGMTSCVECTITAHCMANETCVSNQCKLNDGETCGVPGDCVSGFCTDGVCCADGCAGLCKRCDVVGSEGTCSNILSGDDPNNECSGAAACNGLGMCEAADGAMCSLASECESGFCEDSRCCENACAGDCRGCAIAGNEGSCDPFAVGTDPDGDCVSTGHSCDGAGVCSCGNDPEPPGLPDCNACTAAGGSCDGQRKVCTINCGNGSCGAINCPAGMDCVVNCNGNNACSGSTITCPANYGCDVSCSDNNGACNTANVLCSTSGTCDLSCQTSSQNSCDGLSMTCGQDRCTATCDATPANFTQTAGVSCQASASGC
jgi:hypothetical protein